MRLAPRRTSLEASLVPARAGASHYRSSCGLRSRLLTVDSWSGASEFLWESRSHARLSPQRNVEATIFGIPISIFRAHEVRDDPARRRRAGLVLDVTSTAGVMTTEQDRIEVRRSVYGAGDLSALSVFGGGFINFGYWRDIVQGGEITLEQRVASQQAMYDLVLDALQIGARDRVLEVGSGRGIGAASALRRDPARVCGIDLMPEQVERAREANTDPRLTFEQGSAAAIPFRDGSFNRLLSVEAAQHFEDIPGFARESHRVLTPAGRLALATFFAADEHAAPELARLLDSFADGLDLAHSIGAVQESLHAAGFTDVTATSIGEHVWPCFDRWLVQTGGQDSWPRNWIRLVERGLVDYYLVTAHKPAA